MWNAGRNTKLRHLATHCNDPSRPGPDGGGMVGCSRKARSTYFAYPGGDDDGVDDLYRMRRFRPPPRSPLPGKGPRPDCL